MQLNPLITVQHTSKIQGSVAEDFMQLTAFNLCHDKDKIKWESIVSYQYCACESDIKNISESFSPSMPGRCQSCRGTNFSRVCNPLTIPDAVHCP